jgi:hypothetical protein
MTALALADALEAYEHSIACGAPSIDQAAAFADLTTAHRERMDRLHALEGFIADEEGQALVAAIHDRKTT